MGVLGNATVHIFGTQKAMFRQTKEDMVGSKIYFRKNGSTSFTVIRLAKALAELDIVINKAAVRPHPVHNGVHKKRCIRRYAEG